MCTLQCIMCDTESGCVFSGIELALLTHCNIINFNKLQGGMDMWKT